MQTVKTGRVIQVEGKAGQMSVIHGDGWIEREERGGEEFSNTLKI